MDQANRKNVFSNKEFIATLNAYRLSLVRTACSAARREQKQIVRHEQLLLRIDAIHNTYCED
jgi:hypothetical protein